jgi:hypothetical protein
MEEFNLDLKDPREDGSCGARLDGTKGKDAECRGRGRDVR